MNRGRLRNGNLGGDLAAAPRCHAHNRRGLPCQCPAMPNGCCRLHGGKSTGAKTAAGIEAIQRAVTKHGRYTKEAKAEHQAFRKLLRACRSDLQEIAESNS
jgi:hypothetical protein